MSAVSGPRDVLVALAGDLARDGFRALRGSLPSPDALDAARGPVEALLVDLLLRYGEEALVRLVGDDWPARVVAGRIEWKDDRP